VGAVITIPHYRRNACHAYLGVVSESPIGQVPLGASPLEYRQISTWL